MIGYEKFIFQYHLIIHRCIAGGKKRQAGITSYNGFNGSAAISIAGSGLFMQQKPYRILLVDDEPGIRKILRLFLEVDGFSVYEAVTASQAISIIQKEKPDLVILDVILCGQTGFEVCEWVKSNPETKDLIVFLFTALNQEHDYREGQRVGCDLYLTKPQNPKDIVEKVKEYLTGKTQEKAAS
jgi:DNA-binding response OmpR family regulator